MKKKIFVVLSAISIMTMASGCGAVPYGTSGTAQDNGAVAATEKEERLDERPVEEETLRTAHGKYRGLDIEVFCETPDEVGIDFTNNSSDGYAFGWVDGPVITCRTTDGEYYYNPSSARILAGESASLNAYFESATGEIQSITISNVYMLSSGGVPDGSAEGDTITIDFTGNADVLSGSDENSNGDGNESGQSEQAVTLEGTGSYHGLEIRASANGPQAIKVEYTNNSADGYSLGWVDGPTIICTTTDGEFYYASGSQKIEAGASGTDNYYFDSATGDLISVTIDGINELSGQGLPTDFSGGGSVTVEMN